MGTGKNRSGRPAARAIEEEYLRAPRKLAYFPPVVFSRSLAAPLCEAHLGSPVGKEYGAFEIKAQGDRVKAYGLLWMPEGADPGMITLIHHRQVCPILRKILCIRREFGSVVLGGGYLEVDYLSGEMGVFGQSGDYGRVPAFILSGAFFQSGFRASVRGVSDDSAFVGEHNREKASDWYLSHGIEVDNLL